MCITTLGENGGAIPPTFINHAQYKDTKRQIAIDYRKNPNYICAWNDNHWHTKTNNNITERSENYGKNTYGNKNNHHNKMFGCMYGHTVPGSKGH